MAGPRQGKRDKRDGKGVRMLVVETRGLPIGNGIITVENAALALVALKRRLAER